MLSRMHRFVFALVIFATGLWTLGLSNTIVGSAEELRNSLYSSEENIYLSRSVSVSVEEWGFVRPQIRSQVRYNNIQWWTSQLNAYNIYKGSFFSEGFQCGKNGTPCLGKHQS